eukprot:3219983-Pleurochrysis_carterae.AAC.1
MISASHDESATEDCFFDAQEMAAWLYMNTYPDVECCVAQFESKNPLSEAAERSKRRPMERWWE